MILSKSDILESDDLPRQLVPVPEWGGDVLVRTMTGLERDRFEAEILADRTTNVRARVAAVTMCDEHGERLFTDADVAALGAKSAAALDRVFDAAMRLNRITKDDVESLEKNSETTRIAPLPTDSPHTSAA